MQQFSEGVTVMLDVKRDFGNAIRTRLESEISHQAGVTHAEFSPYVPRVMFIQYDRQVTNSQAIRNKVHQFLGTDGPATCLISM